MQRCSRCRFYARCQSLTRYSKTTTPDLIGLVSSATFSVFANVNRMDWAALLPDWSCIDHVWGVLGRVVHAHLQGNSTLQDLRQFLREEWARIPQQTISKLLYSSKNRVCECRQSNGGYTHFSLDLFSDSSCRD